MLYLVGLYQSIFLRENWHFKEHLDVIISQLCEHGFFIYFSIRTNCLLRIRDKLNKTNNKLLLSVENFQSSIITLGKMKLVFFIYGTGMVLGGLVFFCEVVVCNKFYKNLMLKLRIIFK